MSELPQAETADTDSVQVALQAAQALWSRGDTTESLRWLKRAAESASEEGADLRSLQLAKAAAELRAMLFPSDAPPPPSARAAAARELTGVRPTAAFDSSPQHESASAIGAGSAMDEPGARPEDAPPSSRSPSSAPQYVVHRPREAQRQLMGLSSSTLETAVQRNGTGYASVPSWSAGAERRTSSPPPLPRAAFDDYEELDAVPDEETDDEPAAATGWSAAGGATSTVATWRPTEGAAQRVASAWEASAEAGQRQEADSDSSPRVATLPPAGFASSRGSSPPPLPELSAFGDEDDPMRPEQPTVLLPPQEEEPGGSASSSGSAGAASSYLDPNGGDESAWDSDPRMSNWDSGSAYGWGSDARGGSWSAEQGGSAEVHTALEPAPPKLTARVHHQAVRVSFAPDPRVPGQYVVRALREGERPVGGERVALLVALEPGVPLV